MISKCRTEGGLLPSWVRRTVAYALRSLELPEGFHKAFLKAGEGGSLRVCDQFLHNPLTA